MSRGFKLDDKWIKPFIATIRDPSRQSEGVSALDALESNWGRRWDLVGMYILLRNNDRAFNSAEETGSGTNTMNHIWMPNMRSFRQDSRFAPLMDDMGLISYWQLYGWPDTCHSADEILVCE